VGHIIAGRSKFACMELFHSLFQTFLARIILKRADVVLPLQPHTHHCWVGSFSLIFWFK